MSYKPLDNIKDCSIYIKFSNKQNESMLLGGQATIIFGEEITGKGVTFWVLESTEGLSTGMCSVCEAS